MKVTVKSMKAGTFEVEADATKPIRELKEAIYELKKTDDMLPDAQKIIFSGKLLKDDDTLEKFNFKETDFVVVMGGKKAPPAKRANTGSSEAKASDSTKMDEKQDGDKKPSSTAAPQAATSSSSTAPTQPAASVPGGAEAVSTLTAMGFDREKATQALAAAFGNIERAVEYLQTGIPSTSQGGSASSSSSSSAQQQQQQQQSTTSQPSQPQQQQRGSDNATTPSQGVSSDSPIAFLHTDPSFNQLRNIVQSNPTHLPSLLVSLAESNPDLVQLINDNQEDFYHLVNAPPMPGGAMAAQQQQQQGQGQGQPGRIELSPEDAEAIGRLEALGFDRPTAAQAYFACEKDENLAANWLFEHGNE